MTDDGGSAAALWSSVAGEWREYWGSFADPARRVVLEAAGIGPGSRVLDVGCGSGELLEQAIALGASASGVDPAAAMVELARTRVPSADIRSAGADSLPFEGGSFDLAVAVNALQFADDPVAALREQARVVRPGGTVAVVSWAEAARNDVDVLERALAEDAGEEFGPEPELRLPGGLERLFSDAGVPLAEVGLVPAPWLAADDDTLVRGILLGESAEVLESVAPVVLEAARPFRTAEGGYRLVNALRFAIGRVAG